MAKDEYICRNCKKVKDAGFIFKFGNRYKCPSCGKLCPDCIKGIFGTYCKKCGKKVLKYVWGGKRWKKE